ncbi:MAG: glycosyltransferase family 2 protein [Thermogutta sp.]
MNRSLSAILPFRNAGHVVLELIPQYVDVFSELSSEWEIVAVDDGSHDATPELLSDFSQIYPQVRVATHGQARGFYATLCTGLSLSVGNTLFLPLRYQPMTLDALHRLWSASRDHPLVIGLPSDEFGEDEIECLLLQRRVASPILPALSTPERLAAVVSRFESQAVVVPLRRKGTVARGQKFQPARESFTATSERETMPRAPKSLTVQAAREVFSRIKQFAFDE